MSAADRSSRALLAGGVLTALVSVLLAAFFFSGWNDVRMRQRDLRQAPRAAADAKAVELARDLRSELDALINREFRRPYFHYQNLMHDPRTSGLNVAPSPLASGSDDVLVRGYFQIDGKGRATTPTINDEVPQLSDRERLNEHRTFRDRVSRDLSAALKPTDPVPVAAVASAAPRVDPLRVPAGQGPSQTLVVDPSAYAQNANPTEIYSQQMRPEAPLPPPAPRGPVIVIVSPFEWRTMAFDGTPTLVAVRQAQTPDGTLAQGFVLNQQALLQRLSVRGGDMVATAVSGDSAAPFAPGWGVAVAPQPRATAQAEHEAGVLAQGFLTRFGVISALAVVAAGAVLLLVSRAETLARERSRFAAAAAHELRTPLAGLQLYGDMLADGLGDPNKVREYANHISEDAARLGRVVSNMLGFSQLERGSLQIDAKVGALDQALHEIAEHATPALTRAGARLAVDVPDGIRARFDRDALTRIVGNLLDNAQKYSQGASDRSIRLSASAGSGGVEITVEDHGPGVVDRSRLFRPFSRGATSGDGPAGLGLGLALSRSLARAMHGDLTYRPTATGATFVLTLPAE